MGKFIPNKEQNKKKYIREWKTINNLTISVKLFFRLFLLRVVKLFNKIEINRLDHSKYLLYDDTELEIIDNEIYDIESEINTIDEKIVNTKEEIRIRKKNKLKLFNIKRKLKQI